MTARRQAGLSGVAAALLFAAGNAIWALGMPEDGTAVPEVVEFYGDTADRIVIGGSISLLSIAVFLLFAAALRNVLIEAGDEDVLATAAFGGAVLGMAAGLGAEAVNMVAALRAQDDELTGSLAQSLFEVSQILGSAASGVGLGLFALAAGVAALRGRPVVPRGVAIVTVLLGVLLLTPLSHLNWLPGATMIVLGGMIGATLLRSGPPAVRFAHDDQVGLHR
jgi:hypothetical protein